MGPNPRVAESECPDLRADLFGKPIQLGKQTLFALHRSPRSPCSPLAKQYAQRRFGHNADLEAVVQFL